MIDSNGYAILDVETTGLFPGAGDRIVEIAIIRLDENGHLIDTYSTLINPKRDIGATHVHGITAADVKNAPFFQDIVGDVIKIMRGAALVAHNVSFDRRFLYAEFAKIDLGLPDIPCFCTMQLSKLADRGVPSRKLDVLCEYFGISLENAHTAYADTKATAELFTLCVNQLGGWQSLNSKHHCIKPMCSDIYSWPEIEPSGIHYSRKKASEEIKNKLSYIETLVAKLPVGASDDPIIEDYLALLDRVLEDRIVDETEFSQMELLANELDMSRDQAIAAHHQYMHHLILVALDDGIITKSEEADLEAVRKLLNISEAQFNELLKNTINQFKEGLHETNIQRSSEDVIGQTVCFTGALNCTINGNIATRTIVQRSASDAGMIVQKGVTKKLDILVVADPNSMSGKARKAREYGVRIIAEPVFWNMVGVNVEW